ncbi:tetratricopeptide repeat protein [Leptospira interrogans]|jgi:tetratricopeptide (TPR) repeat protein
MRTGLLKRIARCVAVLSAFTPLCSAALAADAQSYQLAATKAVARMDFARAIEIYSKGLDEPFSLQERADLLRMRGVAAHLANKRDQAEADFNAVVKLVGSTDPRAYSERGFFYHYEGRPEQALADYSAGAALFPDNGKFPNGQGLALSNLGRYDEAIAKFNEAIRLDPASAVFMVGRAEAYNRSDRPQRALEDYAKAPGLGHLVPAETYRLRVGVGVAHFKLRNYKAAIDSLDAAVEIIPNSSTALRYRALVFEATNEPDRASRDYEAVLKLKPDDELATKQLQKLRPN